MQPKNHQTSIERMATTEEFHDFLHTKIIQNKQVQDTLISSHLVKISITSDMALYIQSLLNSSEDWWPELGTGRFTQSDDISISLDTVHLKLIIEIPNSHSSMNSDFYVGVQALRKFTTLIKTNPLSALQQAVFMAKWKVNFRAFPSEISEVVEDKVNQVDVILNPQDIILSKSPRDFSPEAWGLYKNELTKPKFQVTIWEQTFFLTEKFTESRQTILGYVKFHGIYHARFFYYSKSGGNWHCALWAWEDWFLSKWEFFDYKGNRMSYERGTLIVPSLSQFLEKIPVSEMFPELDTTWENRNIIRNKWVQNCTPIDLPCIENACVQDMKNDIIEIYPFLNNTTTFAHIFWHDTLGNTLGKCSLWEIDDFFRNTHISEEISQNIKFLRRWENGTHLLLNTTYNTIICESILNGEKIHITFAHTDDSPENYWIEDITFTKNSISSWGFLRRQINGGVLTSKPVEYHFQCPWIIDSKENPQWIGRMVGKEKDYIDIRPYIQQNPLIQIFKENILPTIIT